MPSFNRIFSLPLYDEFGSIYNAKNQTFKRYSLENFKDNRINNDLADPMARVLLCLKYNYLFSPQIIVPYNWLFNNLPLAFASFNLREDYNFIFKDDFINVQTDKNDPELFNNLLEARYPDPKAISSEPSAKWNSSSWLDMYNEDKNGFNYKARIILKFFIDNALSRISTNSMFITNELENPAKRACNLVRETIDGSDHYLDSFKYYVREIFKPYFKYIFSSDSKILMVKELFNKIINDGYLSMTKLRGLQLGDKKNEGYINELNSKQDEDEKMDRDELSWFFRYAFLIPAHASVHSFSSISILKNKLSRNHGMFSSLRMASHDLSASYDNNTLYIKDEGYPETSCFDNTFDILSKLNFRQIAAIRKRTYWERYREKIEKLSTENRDRGESVNIYNNHVAELLGNLCLDHQSLANSPNPFYRYGKKRRRTVLTHFVVGDIIKIFFGKHGVSEGTIIGHLANKHIIDPLVHRPVGKFIISNQLG